jgi:hypothetical protein
MRRMGIAVVALASILALSAVSAASAPSFRGWASRWSAETARDNARVVKHCQALFGSDDLRFGMCYVKAGRANLQAERVVWEAQVARVARGQVPGCRSAIGSYVVAARVRQMMSLSYLDSHRRATLSRIASDIAGEPYATLKSLSDEARARAVAICG